MTERRSLSTPYGIITYTLTLKRVKNINLRVKPSGEVCVSAPPRASRGVIDGFVAGRAKLITEAINRLASAQKPSQEYRDGASIWIFGSRAVIRTVSAGRSFYSDGVLTLAVLSGDCEQAYLKWEKVFCEKLFREMTDKVYALYARRDIPNPSVSIRDMSSRWGSCRTDRAKITLNRKLLHAPPECAFYVVAHELAHFVQPNHSAAFYAVVAEIMPDYKARKKLLESFARENIG